MKKLYNKKLGSMLLGTILLSFAGCYERGPDYVEDLDVVVTNHDVKFDFIAASGRQFRYVNTVPILVVADYVIGGEDQMAKPFAGLGIGTTYTHQDTQMGQLTFRDDDWQFTLAPEVGVKIGVQEGINGYLSARYNNSFSTTYMDKQ
jgi:opacity protein-like surface antigen